MSFPSCPRVKVKSSEVKILEQPGSVLVQCFQQGVLLLVHHKDGLVVRNLGRKKLNATGHETRRQRML